MDAKKIARYYGSEPWVYKVLLQGTALKFQRWKRMLNTKIRSDMDDVSEEIRDYAREMCCTEIEEAASALHDCCQAGDPSVDTHVQDLCTAIDRLSALATTHTVQKNP